MRSFAVVRCCGDRWQLCDHVENLLVAGLADLVSLQSARGTKFSIGLIDRQLGGRALVVTVKLRHACHIERAKAGHDALAIIFVFPHLRVMLSQLAITLN